MSSTSIQNRIFYILKPILPRAFQLFLRRGVALRKLRRCAHVWPIDERAAAPPRGWSGWPGGKRFALVLTHDVDTARGQDRCLDLARLEIKIGFRSSFNFVPRRYAVSPALRRELSNLGFEIGVHGLYHDGRYFASRSLFQKRAKLINEYVREWGASGYRSPSMLHNLEWIGDLEIDYDASTFDTDPFEPQSDGVGTIFPFLVSRSNSRLPYVELPYTLPQDFTLFVLLREADIRIWKRKLDWIASRGGMALVNTHPDYMRFINAPSGIEEYPAAYYRRFLEYATEKYEGQYWHALPRDVARFVRGTFRV
ncbi:MAG: hypothetical protein WHT06_05145 [Desulfobacterales bacterium]